MKTKIDDFTGAYGENWVTGILTEHLSLALSPDTNLHVVADRTTTPFTAMIRDFDTGEETPILCSELVEIWTEDGKITGRCGTPVTIDDDGPEIACPGHAETIKAWRKEREDAAARWEREADDEYVNYHAVDAHYDVYAGTADWDDNYGEDF